jgi:hypothetical protein
MESGLLILGILALVGFPLGYGMGWQHGLETAAKMLEEERLRIRQGRR